MRAAHGGNVEQIASESGVPAGRILDFSANVNPMGLPACARERLARDAGDARLTMRYPDPQASELRQVLSQRLGISGASIVIGAGADALLHAAVRALAPRVCVISLPAFSEYERACRALGCEVAHGDSSTGAGDLVVLNNPHNPTGSCASREQMQERVAAIRATGASVLADEAFIDYVPEAAITRDAASDERVVAVRSLTKFYGCPGLRVGYAVAAPETARALTAQMAAWPVSTLALNTLATALGDEEYARATLRRNAQARTALVAALRALGCRPLPATANFVLCEVPEGVEALELRTRLIREHAILARECDSFAGLAQGRFLRIAVRLEDENARLVAAMAAVLEGMKC